MDSIELKPYNLENESEAKELVDICLEYYSRSPWPPTKEKIMKGGVVYFRAFYHNKQIGISGYVSMTPKPMTLNSDPPVKMMFIAAAPS